MVNLVAGGTCVDAWRAGVEVILNAPGREVFNLITEIETPCSTEEEWFDRYSPKAVGCKDSLSVVARVLFPALARKDGENRQQYLARSARLLDRGRRTKWLDRPSWGSTYFERLQSLDGSANQIESAIHALNWGSGRPKAAIVMHLSSPRSDTLRPRGAPCLQFIEIMARDNQRLDMFAVYRNHDFLNKALGNFIGLGRLLEFIATESGNSCGKVVCHSVHAEAGNASKLRQLADR